VLEHLFWKDPLFMEHHDVHDGVPAMQALPSHTPGVFVMWGYAVAAAVAMTALFYRP
jgi:hypothetical protein